MNKKRGEYNESNAVIETVDGNNVPVSFQLMQSIYNEITGKKEELSKSIYTPFKLEINDIQQLNSKIEQFKEQYNIISDNCSVSIFYENDTTDVFSSFERFLLLNISNTSPVEILVIKYKLLIILPKSKKPQSYEIELRIRSLAQFIVDEDNADALQESVKIVTGYYEVKYVDYIVGQSLMDLMQRWFDSLDSEEESNMLKYIKKIKGLDDFIEMIIYITAFLFLYILVVYFIPNKGSVDSSLLLKSIIIGGFVIMISGYIGVKISKEIKKSINKIYSLSYININKGDSKIINKFINEKRSGYIKGVGFLFFSIIMGVVSSLIAWFITK